MSNTTKRLSSGLLLLAWMAVIYFFSDQPNSNEVTENIFGSFNYFVRKGAHMTEYAILFVLALWFQSSFAGNKNADQVLSHPNKIRQLLLPFMFAYLYAMSDEWHQSFVPGRTALFSDALIDSCGAGIAAVVTLVWNSNKRV